MKQEPQRATKTNKFSARAYEKLAREKVEGKKILLTQSSIQKIAGSEIVLLELAERLQELGAKVGVYSWYLDKPMADIYRDKNILLLENSNDPFIQDLDFVWIQHQVLPQGLLEDALRLKDKGCVFIYNHMSGIETNLIEQPYIYKLEQYLASKIVYVSEEAKKLLSKTYFSQTPEEIKAIYPNPAPVSFFKKRKTSKTKPAKILVVSNHPPKEISALRDILAEKEVQVEYLGDGRDSYKLLDYETLSKYDAVISIGKTVQYCLVSGIPVYVYDHFGGPGYLNKSNLETAQLANYSGRGFDTKSTEEIAEELIKNYSKALKFQTEKIDEFRRLYSIDRHIAEIFSAERRERQVAPDDFVRFVCTNMVMHKWSIRHQKLGDKALSNNKKLAQQYAELESKFEQTYDYRIRKFLKQLKRRLRDLINK